MHSEGSVTSGMIFSKNTEFQVMFLGRITRNPPLCGHSARHVFNDISRLQWS